MAYRKFKRRRRRRRRRKPRLRRTRRRVGRRSRITSFRLRQPSLLPDTLYVKLKWAEIRNVPSDMAVNKQIYDLNNPFKPVDAVTMPNTFTQPLGWDEWGQFYDNYQCFGSQINVLIFNRGDNLAVGHVLLPVNDAAAGGTFRELKTNPYARTKYTSGTNGKPFARFKQYMSVKKLEGRQTKDLDFTASIIGPPVVIKKWILLSEAINGTDLLNLFYDVTITFYLKFFGRPTLETS